VYLLLGPDPDGRRSQRVYVGEADDVRVRLDAHQKEKDFWTSGYVLSTTDDSLNKAHVRYLESRLLQLCRAADTATLDNATGPPLPALSEAEIAVMEEYLETALMLLPLLGVTVFQVVEPTNRSDTAGGPADAQESSDADHRLFFKSVLTHAEGQDDPRGFMVFAGALGRREQRVMMPGYGRLRAQLLEEGLLEPVGDQQLRLTKTFLFDSPSAAASVLSGGNKNGRTEWRDATGRTLKAIQEQGTV
jgi:hypothetical protein